MGVSSVVNVFDYPYSAALIIILLLATAVNSPAPVRVKDVLAALALAPMIRLMRPVIDLLEKTAQAHAAVLKNPPHKGLFMGYGDSSINFELRAWTAQFGNWLAIRCELAAAVYDAVYAAGMAFPFPQREKRVLNDSPAPKAAGPRAGGSAETAQNEK